MKASGSGRKNRPGDAAIFIACLLIAIVFWLLTVLARPHSSVVFFPVVYTNIPADKIPAVQLPDTFAIEVSARGFDLLMRSTGAGVRPLELKIDPRPGPFTVSTAGHFLRDISRQLGPDISVIRINPDSVHFEFNERFVKKVPVRANVNLTFAPQYGLSDHIHIVPDCVEVSGARSVIEALEVVLTGPMHFTDLSEPVSAEATLLRSAGFTGTYSHDKVQLTLPVEKFTEGKVEVPVTILNLEPSMRVKIFPDKVAVTFLVALTRYADVRPDLFSVAADFSGVRPGVNTSRKVSLVKSPAFVRSVRFSHDKVGYVFVK